MTQFQPEGWKTITPRLFTSDVDGLVGFMKRVLHAQGTVQPGRPTELHIGDSIVLVSDSRSIGESITACLYVYVEDVDTAYSDALQLGAVSIEPATNMAYGDRRATVKDPWGNLWQIATSQSDFAIVDGSTP